MTAQSFEVISRWRNMTVLGADGVVVGHIEEIYLDDRDDQPRWALVSGTGSGNLVPIADAVESGGKIHVSYGSRQVLLAPSMPAAGGLSEEEELELHEHYDLPYEPRPIELDLEPVRNPLRSVR
jgi:sporulation protein YlmC with PRC-barrel domain